MKKKKKKIVNSRKNDNNKEKDLMRAIRNRETSEVEKILKNNNINLNKEIDGNLPIFEAIGMFDLDLVKLLVDNGASLEKKNINKLTVLSIAIISSKSKYYEYLAEYVIANSTVEHLNKCVLGITPLMLAINAGNKPLIKYLVEKGASVVKRGSENNTPLHVAVKVNDEDIVKFLLKKGAFLEESEISKVDFLYWLIVNNYGGIYDNIIKLVVNKGFEKVKKRVETEKIISKKLVTADRAEVSSVLKEASAMRDSIEEEEKELRKKILNKRNSNGGILLIEALRNKKNDIVKFLVESGADVNIHDENGENAVGLVCFDEYCRDLELLRYFCENGADLKGKYKGESIVKQAFIHADIELIKHMYISHINVYEELKNSNFVEFPKNIVDEIYKKISQKEFRIYERGFPELWVIAFTTKDLNDVKLWIEAGYDVNEVVEGKTLLWECCFSEELKNLDTAQLIIENGADMNISNNEGQKIVTYACQENHIDVLDMMIANGACLDVQDRDNKTALMYACINGNKDIVKKLLDNNVNANLQDKEGKTALMYACINGYECIAEMLINRSYITVKDNSGHSAIIHAYENNREDILKLFIEKSIGIYEKDKNNKTLLWNICLGKRGLNYDLAKMIIPKYMDNAVKKDEVIDLLLEAYKKKENVGLVELILDSGLDVNTTYDEGKTLFINACERNNMPLVQLLCDKGADVTIRDDRGYCGIDYVYANGHREVLEYLIKRGLGNNVQMQGDRTLLWNLCMEKKNRGIDLAKILIDSGEDIDRKDEEGKTLLWHVCENPDTRNWYLAKFLVKNKANINAKNREGKTLFTVAYETWDESLMKFLAENGADTKKEVIEVANTCYKSRLEFFVNNNIGIDVVDDEGRSLLWAFCLNYGMQDLDLAKTIIDKNIGCINSEDINGKTILAEACLHDSYKDVKLIEFLLDNKVKLSYNDDEDLVIMDVVKKGYADVVACFVDKKVDVDEMDKRGNSLLTYACAYGYKDIVRCLVEHGAHVNHRTKEGRTPLMYAVGSSQDAGLVEYLIQNGADINAKDNYGNSVLMCACAVENARIVELLVSNGAKVDTRNREGSTPLMYVCNWKEEDVCMVRYLCEHGANVVALDNEEIDAIAVAKLNNYDNIGYYLERRNDKINKTVGGNKHRDVSKKHKFSGKDRVRQDKRNTKKRYNKIYVDNMRIMK